LRSDIQALRGLAVLLVLATHAKLGLPAGYLGVDIFFVISGYLITRMVAGTIEKGSFSFAGFYYRRAKRLLPAAYVTFLVTALIAPFMLTSAERSDFASQMIGAVTFTANIVLFRQTNYFAGSADFKPLLHIWSLSIEEQYYLLLPALLFFTPRRLRVPGAAAVLAISLILCLITVRSQPPEAFFLVQYRVWELAIGSVGTLALDRPQPAAIVKWLFWPAVVALFAVPSFPTDTLRHPGIDAVIVCVATLVVILRRHQGFSASAPVRGVAWVGDFSYSLYLVHWPIFAFANNCFLTGNIPLAWRVAGALLAVALGWALYRFIEHPIRIADITPSRRLIGAVLTTSLLVAALPTLLFALRGNTPDYAHLRRINYGLSQACETTGTFAARPECRTGEQPRLLVWGDSFAEHLVPGIAASTTVGLEQATSSGCGPFLGMAPAETGLPCIGFNQSVLAHVAASPSIGVVVLASPYGAFVTGSPVIQVDGKDIRTVASSPEIGFAGLKETVDRLHALGKRVVLVRPPPSANSFSIGGCLERRASFMLTFGAPLDCRVSEAANRSAHAAVFDLLQKVSATTGVPIFSFDSFLCSGDSCDTEREGVLLYRDEAHLSVDGSRWIGQQIHLGDGLMKMAR
jgi:peptidoglycan/LPS O-acetylase OafA/YrhL